jgi:hypothetical protein
MSHAANPAPKNLGDFTLPWPAERPANDYDDARRVYLTASVYHHGLTDTVRVAEARANSRVLRLASALMGESTALQPGARLSRFRRPHSPIGVLIAVVPAGGSLRPAHSVGRLCVNRSDLWPAGAICAALAPLPAK